MPIPDSDACLCYDCKHEFVPEKPFLPRPLFISYGHDEHASLAQRLRDDLRDRGRRVWFDEERLDPSHDWEAFIERGLEELTAAESKAESAVVVLMTPHAVRRPAASVISISWAWSVDASLFSRSIMVAPDGGYLRFLDAAETYS